MRLCLAPGERSSRRGAVRRVRIASAAAPWCQASCL